MFIPDNSACSNEDRAPGHSPEYFAPVQMCEAVVHLFTVVLSRRESCGV